MTSCGAAVPERTMVSLEPYEQRLTSSPVAAIIMSWLNLGWRSLVYAYLKLNKKQLLIKNKLITIANGYHFQIL